MSTTLLSPSEKPPKAAVERWMQTYRHTKGEPIRNRTYILTVFIRKKISFYIKRLEKQLITGNMLTVYKSSDSVKAGRTSSQGSTMSNVDKYPKSMAFEELPPNVRRTKVLANNISTLLRIHEQGYTNVIKTVLPRQLEFISNFANATPEEIEAKIEHLRSELYSNSSPLDY